jgi:hypothetical protein
MNLPQLPEAIQQQLQNPAPPLSLYAFNIAKNWTE